MFSYERKGGIFCIVITDDSIVSIVRKSSKKVVRYTTIIIDRCVASSRRTTDKVPSMQDKRFVWIRPLKKYLNMCCDFCGNCVYIATDMRICQKEYFDSSQSIRESKEMTIFLSILHRLSAFYRLFLLTCHCQTDFTSYFEYESSHSFKEWYRWFSRNALHDKRYKN